jgi:hypothetical protein
VTSKRLKELIDGIEDEVVDREIVEIDEEIEDIVLENKIFNNRVFFFPHINERNNRYENGYSLVDVFSAIQNIKFYGGSITHNLSDQSINYVVIDLFEEDLEKQKVKLVS